MSRRRKSRCNTPRKLRCEALERREMLSVNAGETPDLLPQSVVDAVPAAVATATDTSLAGREQALAITAIQLRVDGRDVTIKSLDQIVELKIGSSLEFVGIEYRLSGDESVSGKIAFEAYLNKLRGSGTYTDYRDGRFGGHEQEGELAFGSSSHAGLDGAWKMEAGTESFTLVMVRYGTDEVVVEDRITIRTQVGTPDFVIHPEVKISGSGKDLYAGRSVKIYGTWSNAGEGTYRSYAEVDIYHESDPTKVVWSGALADVVEGGETDKGKFVNKLKQNGFSRSWIPELGGTYTLKFYADPENQWNESSEDNNVFETKVEVEDLRYRPPARDAFFGFGFNHHSIEETPSPELAAAAADMTSLADHESSRVESTANFLNGGTEQTPQAVVVDVLFASATYVETKVTQTEKTDGGEEATKSDNRWLEAIDQALTMPAL